MTIAVRAVALTKHYDLYPRPIDRLVEAVTRRPRHTVFPALQDVSFEVERGETIGVVGQNGAGKSTLLKLLCSVTRPSSGTLEVHGNIASILELGTGFHPEFTGRDNAALNAAILGLSPAEVKQRLPAILEFSELGTFLDRPVKTYSSGMYMRLAFSVAVVSIAEVLIIYEANGGLRQIFTDGRPLPSNDPEPWWFGYSTGKWDGDTLVVETTGFRDLMWLDEEGTPFTTAGKIIERFRRVNYGTLEIEVTVNDPKTFTKPWTIRLNQRLMPDTDLIEFVCSENNRSLWHLVGK